MDYRSREIRLVGTTMQCYADFINQYPGLDAHALLAIFCRLDDTDKPYAGLSRIQCWQRGEYFPGGDNLLRLRCFLHLGGYDVTEFKMLSLAEVQTLALVLALCKVVPSEVGRDLGYTSADTPLGSLWRIVLHGSGYTQGVKDKILEVNKLHRRELNRNVQSWRARIQKYFDNRNTHSNPTNHTATNDPAWNSEFLRALGSCNNGTQSSSLGRAGCKASSSRFHAWRSRPTRAH